MSENFIYTREELKKYGNVFKISGTDFYLKQKNKSKIHIGHRLQVILFFITRNPLFFPTILSRKTNAILFEENKIEKMYEKGVDVPEILYKTDNYFVMKSTGISIVKYIEDAKPQFSKEKIENLIEKALLSLIKMHKKGFAHGGSQIRNYTIDKDGKIFSIDFEEDVEKKEYLKFFQIRDFVLFLLSLEKYKFLYDLEKLIELYESKMHNHTIKIRIKKFFKKYSWIKFLNFKIFKKIRMKDMRNFLTLMEKFENIN